MSASDATSSSKAPSGEAPANAESFSSTAERFTLTGPSLVLDPRIHAYRNDIADIALAGQLFAPHYARAVMKNVQSAAIVRVTPSDDAEGVAELAVGDVFALLDTSGDWAWGYTRTGHLVGYVRSAALADAEQ